MHYNKARRALLLGILVISKSNFKIISKVLKLLEMGVKPPF